jgi:hypothetical protein
MNLADADAAAPRNEREEREVADETLGADLRALKLKLDRDDMFVHSATVDEYLALRQAESEYFWVYSRSTFANITSRALPKALLACREPGPVRFWVMVGVPLQDAAVRLRVLSQMSGRRFMMSGLGEIPGYPRPRPAESARSRGSEIAGLSINWRLDDEETVLLISLGMRVINDGRAEQISDRLRHYAWHLGGFATGRLGRAKRDRCPEELDGEAKNR